MPSNGAAKDPSVSVSFSMTTTEDYLLDAYCRIKMTSKSAFMRKAFWAELSRGLVDVPDFRKLILTHVQSVSQDDD